MKYRHYSYLVLSLVVLLVTETEGVRTNNTTDNSTAKDTPTEQQIHSYILKDYSVQVKPEGSKNDRKMNVLFELKISKINTLDIKKQELSVTTFTRVRWTDPRLKWKTSLYEEMDNVNLGNALIWTPDVVLYNDANVDNTYKTHTELYRSKVMIRYDGVVIWNNLVTWKSSCQVDSTWFPVDKQVCNLTFGSWSYNAKQLQLSFRNKPTDKNKVLSDNYHFESGEWTITSIESHEEEQLFDCCDKKFSTITYTIYIRRYPLFYFIYIFLPLISQLFLFLIIFHIPPESGERLGFGITILLNITMYMIFISEKLPEDSDNTPMLGLIFVTLFYMLSAGLGLSAITMLLSKRKTEIPHFFRKLVFKEERSQFQPNNKIPLKTFDRENQNLKSPNQQVHRDENLVSLKSQNEEMISYGENEEANWFSLMRKIDKILFYTFLILLILIPVIICISLNKDGLA